MRSAPADLRAAAAMAVREQENNGHVPAKVAESELTRPPPGPLASTECAAARGARG